MVRRHIEPKDLDALNLILDRDPSLASLLITKLDALESVLAGTPVQPAQPQAKAQAPTAEQIQTLTDEAVTKVTAWFQANPKGEHSLATVRDALGYAATSKPFKDAIQKVIGAKVIKFNDKRGKGAAYRLA